MSRILLVDDDALILKVYQQGLTRRGFEVDTASDGIMAVQATRNHMPDAVVLDLMMPKFNGADFLRFFRGHSECAQIPVIVLSNAYMNDLGEQVAKLGVQMTLLKSSCSPNSLADALGELLQTQAPQTTNEDAVGESTASSLGSSPQGRVAARASSTPGAGTASGNNVSPPDNASVVGPPKGASASAPSREEAHAALRHQFLETAAQSQAELRKLCQQLVELHEGREGEARLQNLYRKVHFITASAGMARCYLLALMASVFEAMLLVLQDRPEAISPSVLRTTNVTVDLLDVLFDHAARQESEPPFTGKALAVDDDPICNRAAVNALKHARLVAHSTEDPEDALQRLQQSTYDLVLVDIEMPGMNGFELCRRVRALSDYERVPIIFVSSHSGTDSLVEVTMAGGNDLISKPIFPLELAVKAVSHLIRNRISTPG